MLIYSMTGAKDPRRIIVCKSYALDIRFWWFVQLPFNLLH